MEVNIVDQLADSKNVIKIQRQRDITKIDKTQKCTEALIYKSIFWKPHSTKSRKPDIFLTNRFIFQKVMEATMGIATLKIIAKKNEELIFGIKSKEEYLQRYSLMCALAFMKGASKYSQKT